ncbi:MAG: efflux RND transporter periplasmic adaptor subunit [Hyphomicrobium sp.]
MGKPLKYLFTLAVPLGLAGLGYVYMMKPIAPVDAGIVYETAVVGRGTIRKIVTTSGPVRALVTVSVGSQLSGLIDKLSVDFNSEVKAGDVMATIDSRTFEAKVLQARADLAAAKAGLVNQEAALKRGEAVRDQAERASERQQTLQKKGFSATATLENAQRDFEIAKADILVARAQIETARAVITQREAALKQSDIDLERTKIIAPINGTVISRTIDVGQTVAASLQAPELFKLAQDLRRIRIEAQVNEADVGAVGDGNPVTFTVDAYPDRTFEGKVTQVRLAATELANVVTYTVIIEASNNDRKLFPGMTANVTIEASKKDDVLRVGNDALRFKPRGEGATPTGGSDRTERVVGRLKTDLQLTAAQETTLRDELTSLTAARGSAPGGNQADIADPAAMRQRMQAAVDQALKPLLTDEQRALYEKSKKSRETTRAGNVYVLDEKGQPDRRFVRLGISDDQSTEIAGGQLAEGERVIVRAREPKK